MIISRRKQGMKIGFEKTTIVFKHRRAQRNHVLTTGARCETNAWPSSPTCCWPESTASLRAIWRNLRRDLHGILTWVWGQIPPCYVNNEAVKKIQRAKCSNLPTLSLNHLLVSNKHKTTKCNEICGQINYLILLIINQRAKTKCVFGKKMTEQKIIACLELILWFETVHSVFFHEIDKIIRTTISFIFDWLVFEAGRCKINSREALYFEVFMRIICGRIEFGQDKAFVRR